ncbi:MAG: hypothetical protein ACR2RB_16000 [Gammaproteobacteria bacterium]
MGTAALFGAGRAKPVVPADELEWQLWLAIADTPHPVWPDRPLLRRQRLKRGDLEGYWTWLLRAHAEVNFHPHPTTEELGEANARYAELQRIIYGAYLPTYYRLLGQVNAGMAVDPTTFKQQAAPLFEAATAEAATMPSGE